MDEVEVTADVASDIKGELPLVTFALFAYNQEKFIREAIEAAFSQTYSSLEIILSDDCSTDRTFEIMQEMAATYSGAHRVSVRRGSTNVGTARHVQEAFLSSSGDLFVVAAGDDVSSPNRVVSLVRTWNAEGRPPGVVHSGWEVFQEGDGRRTRQFEAVRTNFTTNPLEGYARSEWLPAAAPTVAYTREVFESFPPLLGGSIIEDAPLFFRAALVGRFMRCEELLVRLRKHDENSGTGYSVDKPGRWNRFMRSKLIAFCNMQADLAFWRGEMDPRLRSKIERRVLAVAKGSSSLLLPESRDLNRFDGLRLFFRMVGSPAVASRFRLRFEYAMSFFGFEWHLKLKNAIRRLLRLG